MNIIWLKKGKKRVTDVRKGRKGKAKEMSLPSEYFAIGNVLHYRFILLEPIKIRFLYLFLQL